MKIKSLKVKNFRAFKDAKMEDIPPFCVIIGANGTGKSTLFEIIGFLKDAMTDNPQVAIQRFGGSRFFSEVRSRNSEGPIELELKFRKKEKSPVITYSLQINEKNGIVVVEKDSLKYRRKTVNRGGEPWHFALTNERPVKTEQKLMPTDRFSIAGRFSKNYLYYWMYLLANNPRPLLRSICFENPEYHIHPELLMEFAEEFRAYAQKVGQVFVSTHSPDFLNSAHLEEVFFLVKREGYTGIKRAYFDKQIRIFMESGDQMGELWKQGFFEGLDPE